MRPKEIEKVAPNIGDQYYLYRPTAMFIDPPLCTIAELSTVITIDQLADMHEGLNLKEATLERAEEDAERERAKRQRGGRR